MRRALMLGLVLTVLSGCSWFREPPQTGITTGATVVYNGGSGGEIFSICDKGNLVYLTKSQPAVAVLKDGCNPQVQASQLAQAAAVQAIAERTARTPDAPPPPFQIPQPLLIQIVPGPGQSPFPPPQAVQLPAETREHVIVVPPQTCPACPEWPPSGWTPPPGWVPPGWTPPPAVPQTLPAPAPKPKAATVPAMPKVLVVPQVDPNTASTDDLERLPGVTNKTAVAIARNRPYRSLNELVEKKVLSEADLKALAPYLAIR